MSTSPRSNELAKTNRIFENDVIDRGDYGALEQVYTRNARVLPPGAETVRGRENIQAFWKQAVAGMGITAAKLSTVDLQVFGETLIEGGRAELTVTGAEMKVSVKYIVVWRQEDDAWKWHVDIWNGLP
ncbi:MAG TPA: DUF4440 domain-containing protein [Bryobacteraceae bacterium]|nr:DUF4440 domain-containing protein [Bryobacteraceae bacterium]